LPRRSARIRKAAGYSRSRWLAFAEKQCGGIFGLADIPYIIGTAAVDNIPSQKVLERCGYEFVNEQTLLVHIENKKYAFKYYRRYAAAKP
jgi:hypothetical protein